MKALDRDLGAAAGAAVVCATVVLTVPVTAVRAVFAVPLCLVLPGYAITAATFAGRRLPGPQTLMLVLALSLVTLTIGSLLLDAAPGGLRIGSWTILLVIVVLAGCAVATRRRSSVGGQPRRRHSRPRWLEVILLLIAGLIACSAFVLSRIPLGAPNAVGYTELWMLPSGTAQAPAVRIGVVSAEQHLTTYRLVLQTGSRLPSVVDSQFTLRPGNGTELNVPLGPVTPRVPVVVAAQLYESGRAVVYRRVTAVISPPGSSGQRVRPSALSRPAFLRGSATPSPSLLALAIAQSAGRAGRPGS